MIFADLINEKHQIILKNSKFISLKTISTGKFENNKGVHIENRYVRLNYLTKKDIQAIEISKKLKINNFALSFTNSEKDIHFYINSPGGVVTAGLSIYDTMQYIKPKVSTLCVGQAASMGSLLLTAGEKDMRFSLPNSSIMVHQPSGGYQGQATDIMIHAEFTQKLKRRLNEIYVNHTGQKYDVVEAALERDNFLSPEDAKDWGLIDEIVTNRPKDEE